VSDLIGDREKLRDAEQRIRAGLTAFAGFLAGHEIAEDVIAALCPADVDQNRVKDCFADLLFLLDRRPDRSVPLPHEAEVDLDYMTGERS
jgi:hypothetical protein